MSRIVVFGHDDFERWNAFLNNRGDEGWEVISVAQRFLPNPEKPAEPADEYTLFFKRAKS